jgi:hypothetical protein
MTQCTHIEGGACTDVLLDFQERLLRNDMDGLRKRIDYAERSLTLTMEIESEIPDPLLPQKVQRFREYLEKLRESLRQLQSIARHCVPSAAP